MTANGISLYQGCYSVSLIDKKVEHFTLNEDVAMGMTFAGNSASNTLNMQRHVIIERNHEK